MAKLEDKIICNIEVVEIITEEETPVTLYFDTSEEATYSPDVSEGEEKYKRIKNRIVSNNRTEDLQFGSAITFKDSCFQPEVLSIVDGGTVIKTAEKITGYSAPAVGVVVSRKKFTLNIYTSERGTDGEVITYVKFTYPSCKGTPAKFSFKDGDFMTPEYTVKSRPAKGAKPFEINYVAVLPTV